ncbi:MAG: SDR family NAD(P)-dependent oxidoreductase [Bacteriovoracaceae bacterium]
MSEGRKIFITGGTSGIGLELSRYYLDRGDVVGVCGRDLSKVPDLLKNHENFFCEKADVSIKEEIHLAVKKFSKTFKSPGLQMMIANAGRSVGAKSVRPDFNAARDVVNSNVMGVINTFEAAYEEFEKMGSGHLVAVASVAGFVGLPGAGPYSASKAAVLKYCESLSLDLKNQNISVSVIAPGFIDTPLTQKNNHSMPFMMTAEKAAKMIASDLDQKKRLIIFPWQMRFVITLLDKMPRRLYHCLMSLPIFNYAKQSDKNNRGSHP